MKRSLLVLALAAACSDPTTPVVDDSSISALLAGPAPDGTWKFSGNVSHFTKIQFVLVRAVNSDEMILDGEASADLNCAPGATTTQVNGVLSNGATAPMTVPCHLTGRFYGKQTSVSTITGHISIREAPVAIVISGTLDATASNMTASIDSRANTGSVGTFNGVAFAKSPLP